MDLLAKMNQVAFLGPEFLTWLWYRTETAGESFSLDGVDEPIEVWFDDRLVVGSTLVNAQENHFRGGHPPTSLEARSALRLGKLATQARLRFVQGSREWSFILKGVDMTCSGVKIPAILSKDDDERFYERMYLLEELDAMLTCLFGQFLKLRVSDAWTTAEMPAIREWVSRVRIMADMPPAAHAETRAESKVSTSLDEQTPSERNTNVPPWEDPIGNLTK